MLFLRRHVVTGRACGALVARRPLCSPGPMGDILLPPPSQVLDSTQRTDAPYKPEQRKPKRKLFSSGGDGGTAEVVEMSDEAWAEAAAAEIMKIREAMEPVAEENGMSVGVEEERTWIDLGANRGSFVFQPDVETRELAITSPVTGVLSYRHDAASGTWRSVTDDHDLEGLVVRDFLRAGAIGLPKL